MGSSQRLAFKADLENLDQARDFIERTAGAAGLSRDGTGDLLLAIDEAVTNIIMHGCKDRDGNIELETHHEAGNFMIHIRDNGRLFNPTEPVDVDLDTSPLEREEAGGFGVFLIQSLVDEITYQVTGDGRNQLTLVKSALPA